MSQHLTDGTVVLDVLGGYGAFSLEVLLIDIVVGHLGGEILGSNGKRWQEVGQRACGFDAKALLHILGGVTSKESGIAFRTDTSVTFIINSSFEDVLQELLLGGTKAVARFKT